MVQLSAGCINIVYVCVMCVCCMFGLSPEFYDISANKCDIVFSLSELEANVIVMDYW